MGGAEWGVEVVGVMERGIIRYLDVFLAALLTKDLDLNLALEALLRLVHHGYSK